MSNGDVVLEYINEMNELAEQVRGQNRPDFGRMGEKLEAAIGDLRSATDHLLQLLQSSRTDEALAGATPYLRLFGLASGGTYLAKSALASLGDTGLRSRMRIATARFMAERLLAECAALRSAVIEGAEVVLAPPLADLEAAS